MTREEFPGFKVPFCYTLLVTYAIGDLVLESGLIYRNNTAIGTPEAFDDSKWTALNVNNVSMSHNNTTPLTSAPFFVFGGGASQGNATEVNRQNLVAIDTVFFNFSVYVAVNSRTDVTRWRIRKNGIDQAVEVSLTSMITGLFTNNTDTVSAVQGDRMGYNYVESAGSGSLTVVSSSKGEMSFV